MSPYILVCRMFPRGIAFCIFHRYALTQIVNPKGCSKHMIAPTIVPVIPIFFFKIVVHMKISHLVCCGRDCDELLVNIICIRGPFLIIIVNIANGGCRASLRCICVLISTPWLLVMPSITIILFGVPYLEPICVVPHVWCIVRIFPSRKSKFCFQDTRGCVNTIASITCDFAPRILDLVITAVCCLS